MGRIVNWSRLRPSAQASVRAAKAKTGRTVSSTGQVSRGGGGGSRAPAPTAAREPTEEERLASGPRVSGEGMQLPEQPKPGLDLAGTAQRNLATIQTGVSQAVKIAGEVATKVTTGAMAVTSSMVTASSIIAMIGTIGTAAGIGKAGAARIGLESILRTGTKATSRYASNAITKKASESIILRAVEKTAAAGWSFKKKSAVIAGIGSVIGTYIWSEWAFGEAKEGMDFTAARAAGTGNVSLIREFEETASEIYNVTTYEWLARALPGTNIAFSFLQKAKSLAMQWKVNNAMLQNEIVKIESGETTEAYWERVNQQEIDDQNTITANRIAMQKEYDLWKIDAENNQMESAASFWKRHSRDIAAQEAADREAIALFWIEYRKLIAKMYEDNRPSKLNFGIV